MRDSGVPSTVVGATGSHYLRFLLENNHFSDIFNLTQAQHVLLLALFKQWPYQSFSHRTVPYVFVPELAVGLVGMIAVLYPSFHPSRHNHAAIGWFFGVVNGTNLSVYFFSFSDFRSVVWDASPQQAVPMRVTIGMVGLLSLFAKRALAKDGSSYRDNLFLGILLYFLADCLPTTAMIATAGSVIFPKENDRNVLFIAMGIQALFYLASTLSLVSERYSISGRYLGREGCTMLGLAGEASKLLKDWMLTGLFMKAFVDDIHRTLWHRSDAPNVYRAYLRVGVWIALLAVYLLSLRLQYQIFSQQATMRDKRSDRTVVRPLLFSADATNSHHAALRADPVSSENSAMTVDMESATASGTQPMPIPKSEGVQYSSRLSTPQISPSPGTSGRPRSHEEIREAAILDTERRQQALANKALGVTRPIQPRDAAIQAALAAQRRRGRPEPVPSAQSHAGEQPRAESDRSLLRVSTAPLLNFYFSVPSASSAPAESTSVQPTHAQRLRR